MQIYFQNKKINRAYLGNTEFNVPLNSNSLNNQLIIEYIIVGGGGGGGRGGGGGAPKNQGVGGGGGAGGVVTGSATLYAGKYPLSVGDGGPAAAATELLPSERNGETSSFLGKVAYGGGGGGNAGDRDIPTCNYGIGADGASGGGAGSWVTTWGCAQTGGLAIYSSEGNLGNKGDFGGGGAGNSGSGFGGGDGYVWLDGITYAEGGIGGNPTSRTSLGSGGYGGNYFPNTGYGGQSGEAGVVKIRYAATASIATGGTITSGSGYVYHFFPLGNYTFTIPSRE